MALMSYMIWNGSPEIFAFSGSFALRWYGLLFALGFLISQQLLYYMYRKEGKPERDVETLTIYMVVATIIGARLGHIFFYQPDMLWTDPLGVFLPFQFSPFRFTGLQGLASHGGAAGILFALWLYARKKKPGQSYLQVLDRIVILVALTGCLIRLGNFFNSEIIGKPTDSPLGIVFTSRITESIMRNPGNLVETVGISKVDGATVSPNGEVPINIYLFFKKEVSREAADNYVRADVKYILSHLSEFVNESSNTAIRYDIVSESDGNWVTKIHTVGVSRHPAQLYESISCLLLFAFLFWYWYQYQATMPAGRIFGFFLIILWTLRFAYEFLKENQEAFEGNLPINMGQILSIPLILAGIYVLFQSYKTPSNAPNEQSR